MKTHIILALCVLGMTSCSRQQLNNEDAVTAFVGATIITGTDAPPLEDGVILVKNGRVLVVGSKQNIDIPDNAQVTNLDGKFIVPGFINSHGHVGDVKGIEGGHYSRENIIDNLILFASYGITTVVSLGGDHAEAVALRAVNDTTVSDRARLYISGDVITGATIEQAVAVVDSNHHLGVDFMKIRVDDNLGTATKMSEDVYKAVIARSHELGYKIATHMYYLDDAKKLLSAGSDFMAHSVRDKPVDDEFITLIKERKVCYCPTLTRELSTFVYSDTAEFFDDPFFLKSIDSEMIKPLNDPARQLQVRNSNSAKTYRAQLPTAMANLKALSDQGVPIAFGTDSGVPTRFMGYFEHLEMKMMEEAGLSPVQIIRSATRDAAACLGLKDIGTLETGNWADLIVLDKDPLATIANMREINRVVIGGNVLPVDSLTSR